MNKNNIIKYILRLTNKPSANDEIIEAITQARYELESARSIFNNVQDFNLIEAAIFLEAAAKKRYDYYIVIAKKQGVRVSNQYIIDHCLEISK